MSRSTESLKLSFLNGSPLRGHTSQLRSSESPSLPRGRTRNETRLGVVAVDLQRPLETRRPREGRTFPEFDPLGLGTALARQPGPRAFSLNSDNLGRFNIIAVTPGLAAIRSPEGGNQNEDLPPCRACAHGLVSDGATTFCAFTRSNCTVVAMDKSSRISVGGVLRDEGHPSIQARRGAGALSWVPAGTAL